MSLSLSKILSFSALTAVLSSGAIQVASATVVSYPKPACYNQASEFTVTAGGVAVPVIAGFGNYHHCNFSFSGTITISISANQTITSRSISPLAYGLGSGTVSGNTLTFTLSQSRYLIVKINNLPDLVIAADALETSIPASSGTGIFNVRNSPYSADNTGLTFATSAFQSAIDAASAYNGGIVYVPAGVYKCKNLTLKSNMKLYLAGGSVIRGSAIPGDYTTNFHKSSLDQDGTWFIKAVSITNFTIYGRGTIDPNGHAMRAAGKLSNTLVPVQSNHFTIDGITFRDSGSWGLIPTRSDNFTIKNTKHFNENGADYENDAMDIIESQTGTISHSIAISEDDTYSTKTWDASTDIAQNWPGNPEPVSNVTFSDCVAWSRCTAYKVGYGNLQAQTNVAFKNSVVYRCWHAIGINHKYGTPAATGTVFDHIDIEGYWPRSGGVGAWFDVYTTSAGPITTTTIQNNAIRDVGSTGSVLKGYSSSVLVNGITFKNNNVNGVVKSSLSGLNITNTNSYTSGIVFQ